MVKVGFDDRGRGVPVLVVQLVQVKEGPAHTRVKVCACIGGLGQVYAPVQPQPDCMVDGCQIAAGKATEGKESAGGNKARVFSFKVSASVSASLICAA